MKLFAPTEIFSINVAPINTQCYVVLVTLELIDEKYKIMLPKAEIKQL